MRKELYFIPNDYYELLSNIDRKTIKYAFNYVNKDNHDDLVNFINHLIENEIIFLNKNLDLFPVISNELEENYYLRDAIIEIEDNQSSFEVFVKTINQLQDLGCNDLQIRFPLKISTNFILMILDEIDKKNINYVELHINFNENINEDFLLGLIEKYSVVSHIFVYGFSCDKIVTHKIKKKDIKIRRGASDVFGMYISILFLLGTSFLNILFLTETLNFKSILNIENLSNQVKKYLYNCNFPDDFFKRIETIIIKEKKIIDTILEK